MSGLPTPETYRLFVAVTVPDEIKRGIEQTQAALRRALPREAVRWTKREQFHLTLKFLGNVEAQRVGALTEALRAAGRGFAPLDLRAEGIGCFPNLRAPRVVWVGVRDQREQLPELQRAIESATQPFTAEQSPERFTGHVTLGRIQGLRHAEAEAFGRQVAGLATRAFGNWRAASIELIRSQLSSAGASYATLAEIPLAGPPAASA
jgi:RNA 2',3'-cyclic 3'-phosphodiesterase